MGKLYLHNDFLLTDTIGYGQLEFSLQNSINEYYYNKFILPNTILDTPLTPSVTNFFVSLLEVKHDAFMYERMCQQNMRTL